MPAKYVNPIWLDQANALFVVVGLAVSGMVARVLIRDDPINYKRLCGEIILAAIGGFTLFAAGVLNGLEPLALVLMGGLSGLGGVKALEIGGQVWSAISKTKGGAS